MRIERQADLEQLAPLGRYLAGRRTKQSLHNALWCADGVFPTKLSHTSRSRDPDMSVHTLWSGRMGLLTYLLTYLTQLTLWSWRMGGWAG